MVVEDNHGNTGIGGVTVFAGRRRKVNRKLTRKSIPIARRGTTRLFVQHASAALVWLILTAFVAIMAAQASNVSVKFILWGIAAVLSMLFVDRVTDVIDWLQAGRSRGDVARPESLAGFGARSCSQITPDDVKEPLRVLVRSSPLQAWRAGTALYLLALCATILLIIPPNSDPLMIMAACGAVVTGLSFSISWVLATGRTRIVESGKGICAVHAESLLWIMPWDNIERVIWNSGARFPAHARIGSFPSIEVLDLQGMTMKAEVLVFGGKVQGNAIKALAGACARHGIPVNLKQSSRHLRRTVDRMGLDLPPYQLP